MIFIICDKTFATKKTVFYSEDTNEIIKKKEKNLNENINRKENKRNHYHKNNSKIDF